jgi:hypothetical protein
MSDTGILDLIGKYAGTAVTTFVAGGAGAYLGSYLKKKGENLATHEDIDKLVDQVKAVTKATKEIEAKISDDVWSRQKRWEVQQAALLAPCDTLPTLNRGCGLCFTRILMPVKTRHPSKQRTVPCGIENTWTR